MNSSAPTIGFDRYVQLEWLASALQVRSGLGAEEELLDLLSAAGLGKEATAKTRTKLNALCLQPRAHLEEFICRGIAAISDPEGRYIPAAFAWGAAVATYPFFGKVAELIGRLTALQGDCSTAEIHRRMSELYGDREVTKRAAQATIQTQANWGAIQRVEKGKRVIRLPQTSIDNDALSAWLIEAAVRYAGKPVSVPSLKSLPVLFPFILTRPLAYVVSNSPILDLRSEGPSNQFVSLRARL
jgi:hypothetical protein